MKRHSLADFCKARESNGQPYVKFSGCSSKIVRAAFDKEIDAILRERIAGPLRVSHRAAGHEKSATDGMPLSKEEKSLIDELVAHIHEEQVQEIASETALEHKSSTTSPPHHSAHNGSNKLEQNLGKLDKLVEVAPAHTLVINANFASPPSTTPQSGSTTTTAPSSSTTHKDGLRISAGDNIVIQLQNKLDHHQKPHSHHLSTTSHPSQATKLVVKMESQPNDKHNNHSQVPVTHVAGGSGVANNHPATLSLSGNHISGGAEVLVVSKPTTTTVAPSKVSTLL